VGEIERTVGAGAAADAILTLALADLDVSEILVVLTDTVPEAGTVLGAVYNPVAEIVPVVEFPPITPLTDQLTAELNAPVPFTTAVNCSDCPVVRFAEVGEIETPEIVGVGAVGVPLLPPPQLLEIKNNISEKGKDATIWTRRRRMGIATQRRFPEHAKGRIAKRQKDSTDLGFSSRKYRNYAITLERQSLGHAIFTHAPPTLHLRTQVLRGRAPARSKPGFWGGGEGV
jgi:hypothetical protein